MNASSLDERDILTLSALRFDGYQYLEDKPFDHRTALDQFFRTGVWDLSDFEKLAVFFCLQRALCKWDLVYEPCHGRYWRAFRTLFLEVARLPIPEKYADPSWLERWNERYGWQLEKAVACIREVHASTVYDDDAKPDL